MSAYHGAKTDVLRALDALGLRLVHTNDGSEPGKSCVGFFVGKLHEASRRWHHETVQPTDVSARPVEIRWTKAGPGDIAVVRCDDTLHSWWPDQIPRTADSIDRFDRWMENLLGAEGKIGFTCVRCGFALTANLVMARELAAALSTFAKTARLARR